MQQLLPSLVWSSLQLSINLRAPGYRIQVQHYSGRLFMYRSQKYEGLGRLCAVIDPYYITLVSTQDSNPGGRI